jgi:hypothetical protein
VRLEWAANGNKRLKQMMKLWQVVPQQELQSTVIRVLLQGQQISVARDKEVVQKCKFMMTQCTSESGIIPSPAVLIQFHFM